VLLLDPYPVRMFLFVPYLSSSAFYTLSLHDALPISFQDGAIEVNLSGDTAPNAPLNLRGFVGIAFRITPDRSHFECFYLRPKNRSEEHTSELQSHLNLVCRLLLENKKKKLFISVL